MMTGRTRRLVPVVAAVHLTGGLLATPRSQTQTPPANEKGDWVYYGGDARNWRYKPFDQINASNFSSMQVAWRFQTDNLGPNLDFNLAATPIR